MRWGRARLVGRDQELSRLLDELSEAAAGRPRTVVVRGEAGIGKSRLVGALLERVAEGTTTAVGHATPVAGTELPFGPVLGLLRDLVDSGVDVVTTAGASAGAVLRTLLPEGSDPDGTGLADVGLARSRLFASVLHLLGELGRQRPVVVVVEDLQWADSSSLDLLAYLARTARRERLLLVLTVRDEALPRGSATAALLGELTRADGVGELALRGLPADDLDALLDQVDGLGAAARARVAASADGNPFLALELASRDGGDDLVPPRLRDLLLADVAAVPHRAREVLRTAALLGERVDHEALAAAAGGSSGDLAPALRTLVDRGLLTSSDGAYRFRHALVREVVSDDLTEAERTVHSERIVRGLQELADSGRPVPAAELAHHLVAAGRPAEALPMALAAAAWADRLFAFAQSRTQYACARALWPRVRPGERPPGTTYAGLLRAEALAALRADEPDDAVGLLEEGLGVLGPDGDPLERAPFEQALGDALWAAGRTADSLAAYERAGRTLDGTAAGPDVTRAQVSASRAKGLMLTGRLDEALEQARAAARLAAEAGSPRDEVQATVTLGVVEALRGAPDEGLARLHGCLVRARELGDFEAVLRCYGNLTYVLLMHGRYRQAAELAVEGQAVCRQYGPLLAVAGTLVNNGVWALVALGAWDRAQAEGRAVLEDWTPRGVGLLIHLTLAEVAVAQGSTVRVDEHLLPVRRAATDDPYVVGAASAVRVEQLLWADDPGQARREAVRGLRALAGQQDAHPHLMLRALHLRALADLAERQPGAAGAQELAAEADASLAAAREAAGEADLPPLRALLDQCEAEAARAARTGAGPLWRTAAQSWQSLERPYAEAYALWRLAAALLAGHARTAALEPLARALDTARDLRALPLETRLRALAVAGGVERELALATVPTATAVTAPAGQALVRLTGRERQVLALLAAGRTNRQIASALFIAEKTASVHVSNILAKLGATNRVEAAGTGRRLGLVDG